MSIFGRLPLSCAALVVALLFTARGACAKGELDRLTPVPSDQPIPIEDFLRPSLWTQPRLNPSGTYLAALIEVPGSDKRQLLIYNLKEKKSNTINGAGDLEVYYFKWLDDRRLVFFVSNQKLYGLGMLAANVDRPSENYPLLQNCGAVLVDVPRDHREFPLVWLRSMGLDSFKDAGVSAINSNLATGEFINLMGATTTNSDFVRVYENNQRHIIETFPMPEKGITYHYMGDREGHLAFAFTSDQGQLTLYRLAAGKTWLPCPVDLETTDIIGPGDKPDEVMAVVRGETGRPSPLRFLNAATGQPSDVIVGDKDYDFNGRVYRDPSTLAVMGAMYDREGPRTLWFDEPYRIIQQAIDSLFPGQIVRIVDQSEKSPLFLVASFSDRHPVSYHWVDMTTQKAGLIQNTRPWIDPARMRPMQIMKYQTDDGRTLDAYVTLPQGTSRKHPVPLVVLPHGGPWVRDTWGYDSEAQLLASWGYAVLQPNYRGSPGYDWMFPIDDQWNFVKMHDDVTAAAKKLIGTGFIDPTRVAIMGTSFGAYLALSGVTREPSMYRCAVAISGVFDWATVIKENKYDQFDSPEYTRLLHVLGDPEKQAEKFADISPVRHVANIKVPVFVAHGKEDRVASVAESERLVSELEKYHVTYEKLFVSGEGHGMSYFKDRVKLYTEIHAFLTKYMAPLPAAAVPTPTAR
ncbi:MAG TPA: alpha/beta fold hydrolase [Opitutaceae bacterium]|nr:alpha/beta fold hydrolase [Opitutaceae bacterium]